MACFDYKIVAITRYGFASLNLRAISPKSLDMKAILVNIKIYTIYELIGGMYG